MKLEGRARAPARCVKRKKKRLDETFVDTAENHPLKDRSALFLCLSRAVLDVEFVDTAFDMLCRPRLLPACAQRAARLASQLPGWLASLLRSIDWICALAAFTSAGANV